MTQKLIQGILLLIFPFFHKANALDAKQTTVTCNVHNNSGSAVFLYKVENGNAVSLGFKRPDAKNTCSFSIRIEQEGVYFLRKGGNHLFEFNHVIYLKPGDSKTVHVYASQFGIDFDSVKIVNPNTESIRLKKWADLFNAAAKKGSNRKQRDQFFAACNQLEEQAKEMKKSSLTQNAYFNQLFISKINTEILLAKVAGFFYYGERMNSDYDSSKSNEHFYQPLKEQQFCSTALLNSEHGIQLLNFWTGYQLFKKYGNQEQMLSAPFSEKMEMICNDTLRGVYAANRMEQVTNYEKFAVEVEPYKPSVVAAGLQHKYTKKHDELYRYSKGAPGYNFSLYDTKDKLHALADFKGKVVVVDVWAMWCAPCLAEKPFFLKVEEEYKGRNDIIFLGISVDGISQKKVWKDFVAKKGYENIELLSNFQESIMKYYGITGIPRFLIFDKDGRIVTVDAPRPSTPGFKEIIEETLKAYDHAIKR